MRRASVHANIFRYRPDPTQTSLYIGRQRLQGVLNVGLGFIYIYEVDR